MPFFRHFTGTYPYFNTYAVQFLLYLIHNSRLKTITKIIIVMILFYFKGPGQWLSRSSGNLGRTVSFVLFLLLFLVMKGNAQRILQGTVRDSEGNMLVGATVKVKGTATGTTTDPAGKFSINAPKGSVLEISYTGYDNATVTVSNQSTLSITLSQGNKQLNEVIVTALGIAKEKKALGYSVSEIKGQSLTQAREVNVGNSLVGKVAGLNVSSVSGGPGAAVNIQIRGMSSISQSNQPLYVVNGIPMSNETSTGRTRFQNAPDLGDNIGNINPDDIESISVLKGAAASALYGSRAKAGVILITTKRGQAGAPVAVEVNSNYVLSNAIDPTDFQYDYGHGSTAIVDGKAVLRKPQTPAEAQTGNSWGPKIDNQPYMQSDGVMRPYSAAPNNLRNFYRTGSTWTNTIAFSKGFTDGSVRFSATTLNNKSIMPNSGLNRQSFNLSANYNLTRQLNLDVRTNYILEQAKNRPMLGDNPGSAAANVFGMANTVNILDYKNALNPDGSEKNITNQYATNPWFAAYYFINNTRRSRNISSVTMRYNFDNGWFVQGRGAIDNYNDRYKQVIPTGTAYLAAGSITETFSKFAEINADVLVGKDFKLTRDITLSPNAGASYRNIKTEINTASGTGFSIPYVYYLNNVPSRTVVYDMSELETQAVYGTLELNYKELLYLTGSGRTDWFSTLATPNKNNKLDKFYPSVSSSFIFTQLLGSSKLLNFGKLRAAYAKVGQATSPYQTQLSYRLNAQTVDGKPLGEIANTNVPNAFLQASEASELEIGTEMRLFNNKISLDLTWYRKTSANEIVSAPVSGTSGYTNAILNIGKMRNQGFEGLITYTPVQLKNGFTWTTSANGAINKNEILALAPGNVPLLWATARSNTAFVQHIVGLPAGQIVAFDYARDKDGNIQVNPAKGLALRSTVLTPQGSVNPKWFAGWTNSFTYKRFNASFLIDGKFGGKIYSNTESVAMITGKHKATLTGREDVWGKNQTAQAYYANIGGISALYVKDASFIKFRQLIVGYNFPSAMFHNKIRNMNLSVVGRNLFTIMRKTDNIDPEAAYSGDATGLEMGTLPPEKTIGINFSAKF
jgi:TonB-linked SusC/RagA family outer membrane protein